MKKIFAILIGKFLPIVIFLGGGLAIANNYMTNKMHVMPAKQQKKDTLVSVTKLKASDEIIEINALGTVIPAKSITITPELGGKIIEMNKNLEPGGFINEGELIAQIDKRDYETIVVQRQAQVADASFNIEIEEGKQKIAKSEWGLLDDDTKSEANKSLLLRTPHIDRLKSNLKYAEKALAK
ncbi:MAG: hypothetical protein K8S87_05190, partial [Planctomycetes bacterium]|nr:hypothetical protein [Planctomycetota bacterium]